MLFRPKGVVSRALKAAGLAFVIGVIVLSPSSAATSALTSGTSGDLLREVVLEWEHEQSAEVRERGPVGRRHSLVAGIKSASPTTRVTGYKSAMGMADNCGNVGRYLPDRDHLPAGAGARQRQPERSLDPEEFGGALDRGAGLSDAHLANVGSASYQQQWVDERDRGDQAARLQRRLHRQRAGQSLVLVGRRHPDPVPLRCRLGRRR